MKEQDYKLYCENQLALIAASLSNLDNRYKLLQVPDEYFTDKHKQIINIIRDLDAAGLPVDALTIKNKINQSGKQISDDLIIELYQAPIIFNFDGILKDVKHYINKKQIATEAIDLYNQCQKNTVDYVSFLDKIVGMAEDMNNEHIDKFETIGNFLIDPYESKPSLECYETGTPLDGVIDGFRQCDLVIIAARPGMGKTALGIQAACGHPFVYFSLEMPREQLGARITAGATGIYIKKLINKKLTDDEKRCVSEVNARLKKENRIIPIDNKYKIQEIIYTTKQLHKTGKIKGIVIDYLGLMQGGQGRTKDEEVGSITKALKQLAVTLKIPVVLLVQLNRDSDKNDREPELHDLRESGNIEQDADIVCFIHAKKTERFDLNVPCKFIIAKHRNGEIGKIEGVTFLKSRFKFVKNDVQEYKEGETWR